MWVNVAWHLVNNAFIILMYLDSVHLATVGHVKWSQNMSSSSFLLISQDDAFSIAFQRECKGETETAM